MKKIFTLILFILFVQTVTCSRTIGCSACVNLIEFLLYILNSGAFKAVVKYSYYGICLVKHNLDFCTSSEKNIIEQLYPKALWLIDSENICSKAAICSEVEYVKDTFKDYSAKVSYTTPPFLNYKKMITSSSDPLKILVVTDIHIDNDYMEGKSANCPDDICCRKTSPDTNVNENKAGRYGYLGRCDIPFITVESFVDYALKNTKPDIIFFLGDSPAHDTWKQTPKTHYNGLRKFVNLLEKFEVPVYPVFGNHEGYPLDNFEFKPNGTHQWAVDEALTAWKKWFTKEMIETFKENGCYSTLLNDTNLRILAITPFVQLVDNIYLFKNQTDPLGVVILSYDI